MGAVGAGPVTERGDTAVFAGPLRPGSPQAVATWKPLDGTQHCRDSRTPADPARRARVDAAPRLMPAQPAPTGLLRHPAHRRCRSARPPEPRNTKPTTEQHPPGQRRNPRGDPSRAQIPSGDSPRPAAREGLLHGLRFPQGAPRGARPSMKGPFTNADFLKSPSQTNTCRSDAPHAAWAASDCAQYGVRCVRRTHMTRRTRIQRHLGALTRPRKPRHPSPSRAQRPRQAPDRSRRTQPSRHPAPPPHPDTKPPCGLGVLVKASFPP
ncbi:hypothetical protein ATK30_7758 [Amycolatopsis echigonensis]|uniref:Uncharacterized protein n=1 Tax=Amycolatopsis echigonensis TaxID=2576905 RepID=A0A2N3WSG9_9PSEU|nr:hypothetical protein ATK30_7758 [Amycolatopsis niigatensis]